MKKLCAVAFVLLLGAANVAHAAVMGQQLSATATSTNFYGGGTVYALPDLNGTLKAFDLYVSLTGCDLSNNHCGVPDSALYVEIGSSGANEIFSTTNYPTIPHGTGGYPDPVLVHFVWDPNTSMPTSGYPTFVSGTPYTLQLGTSNGIGITSGVVATMTDGANNIYFVGYDALGTPPALSNVSILSSNASTTLAKVGDTVSLTFTADTPDGPMQTPVVTLGNHSGSAVQVATSSVSGTAVTFEASTTLDSSDTDGPLAFSVQVANTFGDNSFLTSTTTNNSSVTFDTTAPAITITSGPAGGSVSTSSPTIFAFTLDDATATSTCAFDGVATSTCSGSVSQALADGDHTFSIVAADTVGNTTSTTTAFALDTTPPVLAITDGPADGATIATSSVSFTFTSDASTILCSYDGAATSTCASPFATTSADGSHSFALSSTDDNGNTSFMTRTFTIDTAPAPAPVVASTGGGNGPPVQNTVAVQSSTLSPEQTSPSLSSGTQSAPADQASAPTPASVASTYVPGVTQTQTAVIPTAASTPTASVESAAPASGSATDEDLPAAVATTQFSVSPWFLLLIPGGLLLWWAGRKFIAVK
jgi:hypothetical protein